jgi:hypothetical protein
MKHIRGGALMPHHIQQNIQQCIQTCHQQANELRSLANQAPETSLRNMLTEGAHHIEMCIRECEFCVERIQQPQAQAQTQVTGYHPGQFQAPQYQPGQYQPGLPR